MTRASKLIFSLMAEEKVIVDRRRMRYIYRIDQEKPLRKHKKSR
jgi:hypothetical protein